MRKISAICLILLFLSISSAQAVSPLVVFQGQKQSPINLRIFTEKEAVDPEFQDSLAFLPVRFTGQGEDVLKAEFPSKRVAVMMSFKFLPDGRGLFLKTDSNSVESLSRSQFLKKFKNDIWWVVYRSVGEDNFIYEAFQIKDTASLQPNFAFDPYDNYQRVENYPFWQALKLLTVSFHTFDRLSNNASWIFVRSIDKTTESSLYTNLLNLRTNYDQAVQKLRSQNPDSPITVGAISKELGLPAEQIFLKSSTGEITGNPKVTRNGTEINLIMRSGFFELSPYCVFSIGNGSIPETKVDRTFFENNFNKYVWEVFYNPESKIALRMVALSNDMPK